MARPHTQTGHIPDDIARRVYDAEMALHVARQTNVDCWISAASDRLHEALVDYVKVADEQCEWPCTVTSVNQQASVVVAASLGRDATLLRNAG